MTRHVRAWAATATILASALVVAPWSEALAAFLVTPVTGSSNLHRLGLTITRTAMGWAGDWSASPERALRGAGFPGGSTSRPVAVTGSDLYRLNCRACHTRDGTGAPPEINSLIEPVRGTSLALWRERMARVGRPMDAAFARQVVSGAKADLLKRLVHGGQKMPAFSHLQGAEVQALVAYLERLAGVPGAPAERAIVEPPVRIGEHLVKGTCHICHDATGPWVGPEALFAGAIPSLASLPAHRTAVEVIAKVRRGTPVEIGSAHVMSRGRMPVFEYLGDDEIAEAYSYLLQYPPQ
jgi:mono/diheme cytochrome c family protein